jgi:hypothetical protein
LKVPFSGGTSLEANFSAPYGGMSIDFLNMDGILELHEDEYVSTPMNSKLIQPAWMLLSSLLYLG